MLLVQSDFDGQVGGNLQDVCNDQVPLGPDMACGLDSLHTMLGIGVDFVHLLVRIGRQGGPRRAELLIGTTVHAGMAVDGRGDISDFLVVGVDSVGVPRDQRIASQSLEGEAHLGSC